MQPAGAFTAIDGRLRDTPTWMPRDKVEVVRQAVDAYNGRDLDIWFAELATPDFEWWPALTRAYEGGCYQGREGVERFVADTSENWEELQSFGEEFRDLGDRVVKPRALGRTRRLPRCGSGHIGATSNWPRVRA
jgi:ketosteroid isomerase-like protein